MRTVARMLAVLLGMDMIDIKVETDKVTYIYRTLSLLTNKSVQELKAKIMSILNLPSDIPIEIRVHPEKKGFIIKSYIVEVDVPARHFEVS